MNSYATGGVNGGAGDGDFVGGLVGAVSDGNDIANSYATGGVNGGAGANDNVGGLVGLNIDLNITIMRSYRTDLAPVGEVPNTSGIERTTVQLQSENYDGWSTNDWDFGTASQYPALRSYKDDDSIQGDLLCGQEEPRAQCVLNE